MISKVNNLIITLDLRVLVFWEGVTFPNGLIYAYPRIFGFLTFISLQRDLAMNNSKDL